MERGARGLLVCSVVLVACGGSETFSVHDTAIVVRTNAPFAQSADLPVRVESTISAALSYWGGNWDDLRGLTIALESERHVPCHGVPGAVGCYEGREMQVSTSETATRPWRCVEQTVLVHEIGHAVIGDSNHTDPRWMDFGAVAARLQGRRGYGPVADEPCDLFPSVWQHVRGTR